MSRYWLTPPDIYRALDNEFHFNFDPCPCPRPDNYNSLALPWGKCNYVNPPFNRVDSPFGGPTAFLRKAIQEQQQGNTSVLLLPVRHYMNIALESGAELRSMGRVRWLDVDTKEPWRSPHPVAAFIFRGKDALLKKVERSQTAPNTGMDAIAFISKRKFVSICSDHHVGDNLAEKIYNAVLAQQHHA